MAKKSAESSNNFELLIDVAERTVASLQIVIGSLKGNKDLLDGQKLYIDKVSENVAKLESMLKEDRIYRGNKNNTFDEGLRNALTSLDKIVGKVDSVQDRQLPGIDATVKTLNEKFDEVIKSNKLVGKIIVAMTVFMSTLTLVLRMIK